VGLKPVRPDPGGASNPAGIAAKLAAAVAEARSMGHVDLELEARLARVEAEAHGGSRAARDDAAQLEKDAREKGFGLVAAGAASFKRNER
jgi:hypothetical protein